MALSILNNMRAREVLPGLIRRYDRIADRWHRAMRKQGYIAAYVDLAQSTIPPFLAERTGPIAVLDAGTGSGGFAVALCQALKNAHIRDHNISIDLMDMSNKMLDAATENLKKTGHTTRRICADIATLNPDRKRYDIILCAHVIDHCPDPVEILHKLHAALAPGGIILFAVSKPHWCTALLQLKWGHHAYSAEQFIALSTDAGFTETRAFAFKKGPPKHTSFGYITRHNPPKHKKDFP
jgi:2-polyprenyl-3-methyl-5-hydroxy-6-metoxy-1,4-benzoquinol methylase